MSSLARIIGFLVLMLWPCLSFATQQAMDRITYGNHEFAMQQVPMLGLWHYGGANPLPGTVPAPEFDFESTANWVGYEAKWLIADSKLYLVELTGKMKGATVRNGAILPGKKFPLVATWFTGKIHLPVGPQIEETAEYESVLVFDIQKGQVKSVQFFPKARVSNSWDGIDEPAPAPVENPAKP